MTAGVNEVGVPRGLVSRTGADDWEHALVSGNGRQGALCYGDASAVCVTLSHERLRFPLNPRLHPPATTRIMPEVRQLLRTGKYQDAAELVQDFAAQENPAYAATVWTDPFVGAATLEFEGSWAGSAQSAGLPSSLLDPGGRGAVRRTTDFASGLVSQRVGALTQEVFVSRPADVVVVRLTAEDGAVSGLLRLTPIDGEPPGPVRFVESGRADQLRLSATFPHSPADGTSITGYDVVCRVMAEGGTVGIDEAGVRVDAARTVLLLASVFVHGGAADGAAPPQRDLPAGADPDATFDALLAEHAAVHGELFDRVSLDLGDGPGGAGRADTEDLLADPGDPALVAALFDAGRYAIISSSGSLPPNLQGVWSGTYKPPWSGDYTLNGNLQTAVAALLPTRTPELLLPLFDLLDTYRDDFRVNAQRLYGARGVLLPAHCATHGLCNHFGPRWCMTFWTAGAAWMARLYYDYWRHTGDVAFLRDRALPFMGEAATFYAYFLAQTAGAPDAKLTFVPSYSPENTPAGGDSQAAINATMDVAAVGDLMRNLLRGAEEAGIQDPRAETWRTILGRLPDYAVGSTGEFAEWLWPGLTDQPEHRHSSHLYPFLYGDSRVLDDPALREAATLTIERRLAWWRASDAAGGSGEMAFGLVWLGLAAARLGLADTAHEIVTYLAARYWRPSLVSTHNAGELFNVDLCGGFPALVTAMLLGSTDDGVLDVLPATPAAWPHGSARGLAAPGPVIVELLTWSPGTVEIVLRSPVGLDLTVRLPDRTERVRLDPGSPVRLAGKR